MMERPLLQRIHGRIGRTSSGSTAPPGRQAALREGEAGVFAFADALRRRGGMTWRTSKTFVSIGVAMLLAASPAAAWPLRSQGGAAPVVLLHGLLRSSSSMLRIQKALVSEGYEVCNVSYPARHHSIEVLAADYVAPAIARCFAGSTAPIHFVTHSLGGIVVRQLAKTRAVAGFGRVVMLAPPNHGSELVDEFGSWWIFRRIYGPAANELGTGPDSLPNALGPAPFEVGVITGDRTINLLLSAFLPRENDGKVSVASARLDGMKDFLVIPASHTFIMGKQLAIDETIRFLEHGVFRHDPPRREESQRARKAEARPESAADGQRG